MKIKYDNNSLVGKKFGKLTIQDVFKKNNRKYCHCVCECGKEKDINLSNLLYGKIVSCGCYRKEISKKVNTKHGFRNHPLYSIWADIIKRCENKNSNHYEEYGKRGIIICEEWRYNPEKFIKWSEANGWRKELTIDRIDVNGNYEPENCRYVDKHIQAVNQRIRKDNLSGYKGIKWNKMNKKWQAYIDVHRKHFYLGEFINKNDAVNARNEFIKENNLKEYVMQ